VARVSRAKPSERGEPEEWKRGARAARAIRQNVARQVSEHIIEADLTGSREYVAMRVRTFAEAERNGDPYVLRAALMDLCGASAAYLVAVDLRLPPPKVSPIRRGRPVAVERRAAVG
jgi:hypothetical protein